MRSQNSVRSIKQLSLLSLIPILRLCTLKTTQFVSLKLIHFVIEEASHEEIRCQSIAKNQPGNQQRFSVIKRMNLILSCKINIQSNLMAR